MIRLHLRIGLYSPFNSPSCMDSSSNHCTKFCAISRMVFPRGESSDNANPTRFSFRMHWPIFVLGPCTLKSSLLLLCSGIISSGFCFYFEYIWRIFLRIDNSWLSCSYYLAKYKRQNCAFLTFLLDPPKWYLHNFSASLEIWHHSLNVNVLSLCHSLIRNIYVIIEYGSGSGFHIGPLS